MWNLQNVFCFFFVFFFRARTISANKVASVNSSQDSTIHPRKSTYPLNKVFLRNAHLQPGEGEVYSFLKGNLHSYDKLTFNRLK